MDQVGTKTRRTVSACSILLLENVMDDAVAWCAHGVLVVPPIRSRSKCEWSAGRPAIRGSSLLRAAANEAPIIEKLSGELLDSSNNRGNAVRSARHAPHGLTPPLLSSHSACNQVTRPRAMASAIQRFEDLPAHFGIMAHIEPGKTTH